jgi:hypothetical protein
MGYEAALEAALFDELWCAGGPAPHEHLLLLRGGGAAAAAAAALGQGGGEGETNSDADDAGWGELPALPAPPSTPPVPGEARRAARSPAPAAGASAAAAARQAKLAADARLRSLRLSSDKASAALRRASDFEVQARVDTALASLFARGLLRRRELAFQRAQAGHTEVEPTAAVAPGVHVRDVERALVARMQAAAGPGVPLGTVSVREANSREVDALVASLLLAPVPAGAAAAAAEVAAAAAAASYAALSLGSGASGASASSEAAAEAAALALAERPPPLRLESLLHVYDLQSRDPFDKAAILLDEFCAALRAGGQHEAEPLLVQPAQAAGATAASQASAAAAAEADAAGTTLTAVGVPFADEVKALHAFLALIMRSPDQSVIAPLQEVRAACGQALPHLYVLERDPSLRFGTGRAAMAAVRALAMTYQAADEAREGPGLLERAVADLNLVVSIFMRVVLQQLPALRQRESLSSGSGAGSGGAAAEAGDAPDSDLNRGRRRLRSLRSRLEVRCAVEEAVAVPLFFGVLRPLIRAGVSGLQQRDDEIARACVALCAEGDPHAILRRLQLAENLVLADDPQPYQEVVSALARVWASQPGLTERGASPELADRYEPVDADAEGWELGDGPTSCARRLVRACQRIPRCAVRAGVGRGGLGADDLLPVLVYATARSRPPALASVLYWLESCCAPELLQSEAGYSIALLQTAAQTIPTLPLTTIAHD